MENKNIFELVFSQLIQNKRNMYVNVITFGIKNNCMKYKILCLHFYKFYITCYKTISKIVKFIANKIYGNKLLISQLNFSQT
uniref:Uncharacterized protein n=1 Tax=Strongyloides papillosus TaxID=174720 RepID=A0A0N5B675_STREA